MAFLLLRAQAAGGAVVQLRYGPGSPAVVANLQFTGLPGESNVVRISQAGDGTITVQDDGAPLVAGENCVGGGTQVTCSRPSGGMALQLEIATSDGADRIELAGPLSYTNSYLSGGSGPDVIIGGPGDDGLRGDAGDDRIEGAAGDDELWGFEGADALSGGPGRDTASYRDHRKAVSVTLDGRPDDGSAGERDNAGLDVENVTGSSGPNRLVGSDAANTLEGGESFNELAGGGGDDQLIAHDGGRGLLTGGPGRVVGVCHRR